MLISMMYIYAPLSKKDIELIHTWKKTIALSSNSPNTLQKPLDEGLLYSASKKSFYYHLPSLNTSMKSWFSNEKKSVVGQ